MPEVLSWRLGRWYARGMTVLARMTLNQDFAPTTAAVTVQLEQLVLDDPPGNIQLDQFFDGSAALLQPSLQLQGQPKGTTVVAPAYTSSWAVDGVDPGAIRTGETKIGADLDSCARTWEQAIIASTGHNADFAVGPLGYELTVGSPPPGHEVPVSFAMQLIGRGAFGGTTADLALLTRGCVETSGREWSEESHIMTMSGSGPEVLWRDVEIDIELAPDHGLTHGEIGILAMEAAGVPDEQIGIDPSLGSPRNLAQAFNCVGLWSFLKDLFRPIGFAVMARRGDDIFREVPLLVGDDPPVMTITERDITRTAGVAIESDATLPTCVDVEGRRIEDSATGVGSGTVTETVIIETIEPEFFPSLPVATQSVGSATITPTGIGAPPAIPDVVTARTTVSVTTVDGCEELTYTRNEAFFNPVAARYTAAETPDGEPRGYLNIFFFDSIPVADDAQEGFFWDQPRFVIFSEVWSRPQFRGDGRRTGTETKSSGWRNIERRIKSRIGPGAAWETENYEPGSLSASFQGLFFNHEHYFVGPATPDQTLNAGTNSAYPGIPIVDRHTRVEIETNTIDECDQITGTNANTTTYGKRPGLDQLYASGEESRNDHEVGVTTTESELRVTVGGRIKIVPTATDSEGRPLTRVVRDEAAGAGLPAAEICTPDEINRDREQRLDVRVCLERTDAEGNPVKDIGKPRTFSSRWVETVEEATAWGQLELSIMHGFPVALTMSSPNPTLDAGDVVELDLAEPIGPARRCKVLVTETTIPPANGQDPIEHQVVVRVPPTG